MILNRAGRKIVEKILLKKSPIHSGEKIMTSHVLYTKTQGNIAKVTNVYVSGVKLRSRAWKLKDGVLHITKKARGGVVTFDGELNEQMD